MKKGFILVGLILGVALAGCAGTEIRGSAWAVYAPGGGYHVPAPAPAIQYVEKCDIRILSYPPWTGRYCYYVPTATYPHVTTYYGHHTGYPGNTPYGWGWERRGSRWYVVPLPPLRHHHRK